MPTIHLSNYQFDRHSPYVKIGLVIVLLIITALIRLSNSWQQALVSVMCVLILCGVGYWLARKSWVGFTLTASHLQQHFYYGGWVVKWQNISQIGICTHQQEGWHQPLPWIGVRLKNYSPFLDGICPRIAREMLFNQRVLLYLGMKQHDKSLLFEDIVLDSTPYTDPQGKVYTGLMAMLANRMHHQRNFHGFDVFISENDLDRSADEFIGLARRYLAAAKPE